MKGLWYKENTGKTVVVFVHGVMSDGITCWTNKNGAYWPDLLKKEADLEDIGIYIYTFSTGIFATTYTISDAADSLSSLMKSDGILDNDVIVFCCHSMGGIVVRKWMVNEQISLAERQKELGLFLLASPSAGSKWANVLTHLTKSIRHGQRENLKYINRNEWLGELHRSFLNLKESKQLKLSGQEIVEDKSIIWPKLFNPVVKEFSGIQYFANSVKIAGSNHSTIAKPAGSHAQQHNILVHFIKSIVALSKSRKPAPRSIGKVDYEKLEELKLDYRVEWTTFIGRTNELEQLIQFVECDKPFTWWILTGNGGAGKSRIALELKNRLTIQGNFFCDFVMTHELTHKARNWTIEQPTLFIIDYAARFSETILELIKDLSTRTNLKYCVRILLIEREINGDWWQKYFRNVELKISVYDEKPLNLTGLVQSDLLSIIHEVLKKRNQKTAFSDEQIMLILRHLDSQMRPLFAMFLGVALADMVSLFRWSQSDLLKYMLFREDEIIKHRYKKIDQPLLRKHKNLLVLSTICYGLTKMQLIALLDRGLTWLPSADSFDLMLYCSLSGSDFPSDLEGIAPLLPDILGEFFVLEEFNQDSSKPLRNEAWTKEIMAVSNDTNQKSEFFVRRVLQDFPSHRNVRKLFISNFFNGYHGRNILELMKDVFWNEWSVLESLWDITRHLSEVELAQPQEKVVIDYPARVYQEATLLMIQKAVDVETQLRYYKVMTGNTDSFASNPIQVSTAQADDKSPHEMTREEFIESFEKIGVDDEYTRDYIQKHVVIDARIPHMECIGIGHLLPNLVSSNKINEMARVQSRLDFINEDFTDPRIRTDSFGSYFILFAGDIDSLDKKINDLFTKIIATPRQVPPIDVTEEKRLFLHKISLYYANARNDIEIAQNYYDRMLNHIFTLGNHYMHENGMAGMAHTAAQMIELALRRNDKLTARWYFKRVEIIAKLFNPVPAIFRAMIQELGPKL